MLRSLPAHAVIVAGFGGRVAEEANQVHNYLPFAAGRQRFDGFGTRRANDDELRWLGDRFEVRSEECGDVGKLLLDIGFVSPTKA